jgi:TetR/AcrR family transcriptional regulator
MRHIVADKNLTRKQRDFLRHREEIMQTALSLFSQKGFANVSIQEIALKSEFAVGTLYKFFSTKEDLYNEVLKEKFFEQYGVLVKAIEVPGTEIDKMNSFLKNKIRWFRENMDYVRLYVTETFGVGSIDKEELDQIKEKIHNDLLHEISLLFEKGIEKRLFKKGDPNILAITLNGLSNGILFELLENRNFQQIDLNAVLKTFLQPFCLESSEEIL